MGSITYPTDLLVSSNMLDLSLAACAGVILHPVRSDTSPATEAIQ